MISFQPWLICLTSKSAFLCCLLVALVGSPADVSAKWNWKDVSADEAVIKLKNWPGAEQCRMRKAMAPNYTTENTAFYCPRWVGDDEPRTYLRVQELMPSYYWSGSYGTDFSEHPMFTRVKGKWFKYFKNPVIKPGQRTKCFNDNECSFQRIEFSVKGRECQWIMYKPDLGNTDGSSGRSDTPYSLEIFTCQTSVPITKKHVEMKPGKVTVTFPAGSSESGSTQNGNNGFKGVQAHCPDGSINNGKGQCVVTLMPISTLCGSALNGRLSYWTDETHRQDYVKEAKRRGISLSDCRKALGITLEKTKVEPSSSKVSPADTSTDTGQRLRELKKLLEEGLISKEEAAAKRKEILKNL